MGKRKGGTRKSRLTVHRKGLGGGGRPGTPQNTIHDEGSRLGMVEAQLWRVGGTAWQGHLRPAKVDPHPRFKQTPCELRPSSKM